MQPRKPQQGAALLALAAVVVLATTWMLVSAFASVAGNPATQVARNARVLAEAKTALISWVARTALDAAESNPGRLPCPQAWGDLGSANEGRAAAVCAATAAGWLPWRSLGLPVMLDAAGQQLWYVVSPGWHLPNSGTNLTINSNTPGQLLLDARPVIALIIAPGPALNIAPDAAQRAAGCTPRRQSRARDAAINPNPRDFLDCQNASTTDNVFVSAVAGNSANPVFNDQVLAITAADLMPALEAAIAKRIERDIVPPLRDVYASAAWGLSAANPVFPFAAPFANPGTSSFEGAAGTFQGLLPFNRTRNGWAAAPSDAYLAGPYGHLRTQSCAWEEPGEIRVCQGEYQKDGAQPWRPLRIEMTATFTNVAMGLRVIDATRMQVMARGSSGSSWQSRPVSHSATISADGSATIAFGATLPNIDEMGWGSTAQFRVRLERAVIADHPLLAPGAPGTGWFVRNEWYRLLYYATAPGHAASGAAPRSCDHLASSCLQVANLAPANKQRAILILAGRSLGGATRPNGSLEDFLDSAANRDGDNAFEQLAVNRASNDRVVVLDANP